ncbi:MAG: FadR/GntR family transcriptional regulator [Propionibacteriaceae bacterium]
MTTRKAFERVLDDISTRIANGTLSAGSALPAERDFATQLGVSRSAVREAIRTLEAQGVIEANVGAGHDSGTRLVPGDATALARILSLHVALGTFDIDDVQETRITLETSNVKLACIHATPEDHQRLQTLLQQMNKAPDMARFNELDTQFHIEIATLGHNQLATDLTLAVRASLERPIHDASLQLPDWDSFRDTLVSQHEEIAKAIISRNSSHAISLIEHHIVTSYTILSQR